MHQLIKMNADGGNTYDYLNNNISHHNGIVSAISADPEYRCKYNLYLTAIITLLFVSVNSALVNHYSHKWFGNIFTGADVIIQAIVFALLVYIIVNSVSPL